MNQPLVSIVIPTYNRAHLIGETLDSVLAQTYTNWECIIVDDGSSDNSTEVINQYIKKDSRFQYHYRPATHKPGGNGARNYGFQMSKGEYVNWLDSDDLFTKNHLELHISAHVNDKKINVSVSNARLFVDNVEILHESWSDIVPKKNCILEMINETVSWPICGVVWSRDSIRGNLFKEDLVSSQEWTFHLLQLIENKVFYKIINVDSCFVRRHELRIGKLMTEGKVKSTFVSRLYVYDSLDKNGYLDATYKFKLIDRFIKAIRDSLIYKYDALFWSMYRLLILKTIKIEKRVKLFSVVFFWIPVYCITTKGYKYLKYNPE